VSCPRRVIRNFVCAYAMSYRSKSFKRPPKQLRIGPQVFCPEEEEMAGAWKETANRGFYYGPKSNNAWNNDSGWKNCIKKENKLAAKSSPTRDDNDHPFSSLAVHFPAAPPP
jgi:hypothetical protein